MQTYYNVFNAQDMHGKNILKPFKKDISVIFPWRASN